MPLVAAEVKATAGLHHRWSVAFPTCCHSVRKCALRESLREIIDCEIAEMWRNVARPVTFFDEHSPGDFPTEHNRRIV